MVCYYLHLHFWTTLNNFLPLVFNEYFTFTCVVTLWEKVASDIESIMRLRKSQQTHLFLSSRHAGTAMWRSSGVAMKSSVGWSGSATSGVTTWPLTTTTTGRATATRCATPASTRSSRAFATWASRAAWRTPMSIWAPPAASCGKVGHRGVNGQKRVCCLVSK